MTLSALWESSRSWQISGNCAPVCGEIRVDDRPMYHRRIAATYSIRIAFLCALWTFACVDEATAESSPYKARVIAAGAPVHSGPGENYYPTDTLSEGDTIEVYREKPGGWLAIRPPMGSYSWVAERDLILK